MIYIILNIIVILFFPFLFLGIINKVKSFWSGRKGPKLLQIFYDFVKLLRKGEVISTTTSFVFKLAPSIILGSTLIASLIVPLINKKSIIEFNGDFIFFAYILAIGKFFSIISAMDTGSSFEGMGASREASFTSLLEPAFFVTFASVASLTGNFSFGKIFELTLDNWFSILIIILAVISFFIMLLTEGSRVPVDDPNTHLELTMMHEVMILDNSGPDLGFILYASGLKMILFCSIIANLLIPSNINFIYSAGIYILIILIIALIVGTIESLMARFRMIHVPKFILLTSSISLIILFLIKFSVNAGLK